jgi:hypothetical protein
MFIMHICSEMTMSHALTGTNRQKKQLFVMDVRTPNGTTLPGNLTIVPSEQKWVFQSIYQLVFPHLYSSEVCSRNQLVLTDEDDAEYKSFESVIETVEEFCKSKVMLYTFHGIWMAFKKDLLPLLDVCKHGKLYGK